MTRNRESSDRWKACRLRRWLPLLAVAVVSLVYVTSAVRSHDAISPVDEYVYADYLYKIPEQGIVRTGEETGDEARDLIACRGVVYWGSYGSHCGAEPHDEDSLYPYAGGTAADLYSPAYFAATWLVAEPVSDATGTDVFDVGRWAGGLWLALGGVALVALLRRLGADGWLAAGLAILTVSTPAIFWANTYLSTDAPALLVGSGLAYLGLRLARREVSGWWLILASPLAVLLKVQFALGVCFAAGLVFAVVARETAWRPWTAGAGTMIRDRRVQAAVAALFAGVVSEAAWLAIRAHFSVGEPPDQGLTGRFGLGTLLSQAFKFLAGAVGPTLSLGPARDSIGQLVGWLCVAGVIGLAVGPRVRPTRMLDDMSPVPSAMEARMWGVVSLVVAFLGGPLLYFMVAASDGIAFDLPARYGLVLVPAFIGAFALLIPRRPLVGKVACLTAMIAMGINLSVPYLL